MNKSLRLIMLLTAVFGFQTLMWGQNCTADSTTATIPALYPDSLAEGNIGTYYEQVITVVVPQDTPVFLALVNDTVNIDLCTLILDSIPNLAPGLDYACSTPDCTFKLDHTPGVVNRFCVVISGTPTAAIPNDTIDVYAHVIPGGYDASLDSCIVITGVPDSLTNVFYQARLAIGNATSIDPTLAAQYRLSLQPNPSMGETQLAFTLPQAAEVSYEIHDLFGRSLYQHPSQRMAEGRQSLPVQAPRLTAGVYIVKLNVNRGEAILSKRWVVQ